MCLWMQNTETPAAAAALCSLEERCAQAQKSTVHTQKGRGGGTRRPVCLRAPCCQHGQLLKYLASNASKEGSTACCTSGLTRGRWRRMFGLEADEVWGAEGSSPTDTHRDSCMSCMLAFDEWLNAPVPLWPRVSLLMCTMRDHISIFQSYRGVI